MNAIFRKVGYWYGSLAVGAAAKRAAEPYMFSDMHTALNQ